VLVQHRGFEPHLKLGEFSVIDVQDQGPVQGELYMIWIGNAIDGPHLRIVQHYAGKTPDIGIRYRFALKRPGLVTFGDGPLYPQYWPEKCLGRIVGIYEPLRTIVEAESLYLKLA